MTDLRELRRKLGGVQATPFEEDNLAIFLVGIFEDQVDSEKLDDTGTWKQEAVVMTDTVLDAIHTHYTTAVRDLFEETAREAEVMAYAVQNRWRQRAVIWAAIAFAVGLVLGSHLARADTLSGDHITIIDGDTVALPCDPARGTYPGCSEHIRLEGIDAPESYRARCEAERVAGLAAKTALADLIRGRTIEITRIGRDRYGRTLARLTADGADVEGSMLAAGHAVLYAPGRAAWADRCRHWCPGAKRCEE